MDIDLTPNGTRGTRISRRLLRTINACVIAVARLVRGRGIRIIGQRVLILTTIGATSGRRHNVPLLYFPDGADRWLVIASYGGSARHPAWYRNMAKHPDEVWVEMNGRTRRVHAASLQGQARAAAWKRITSMAPNYAAYQARTDREIPVIRLTPIPSSVDDRQ
jgi:deazaflavin-dependent oxidoreductase (nitroreductase family)